MQLYDIFD